MANLLQVVGGIMVTGVLTGLFLVIVWGLIYIVMSKVKDAFSHFSTNKVKHNLTT